MVGHENPGGRQLRQILALSLGFIDWEVGAIQDVPIHPEFQPLLDFYNHLQIALRGMTEEVFSETPELKAHIASMRQMGDSDVSYDENKAANYNIKPHVFQRIYNAVRRKA